MTAVLSPVVAWHDVECGGYHADLPLWRELACDAGNGPVLDVGAGAGRVSLDLLRAGHEVVALDREPELLAALTCRARDAGLDARLTIVCADARELSLGRRFALIVVPMQTLQLLGGAAGRTRFLAAAREHLRPGGLLAAALADDLQGFDAADGFAPLPDIRELAGVVYSSRPVALRDEGATFAIERLRETVDPHGDHTTEEDLIRLDRLDAATAAAEAQAAGLTAQAPRRIAETEEHVGSVVVMLRG